MLNAKCLLRYITHKIIAFLTDRDSCDSISVLKWSKWQMTQPTAKATPFKTSNLPKLNPTQIHPKTHNTPKVTQRWVYAQIHPIHLLVATWTINNFCLSGPPVGKMIPLHFWYIYTYMCVYFAIQHPFSFVACIGNMFKNGCSIYQQMGCVLC